MTPPKVLTLRTAEDLKALPQRLTLGQAPQRLHLDFPGLSEPDRSLIETRLSVLLSACGCSEGAFALIAALPLAVYLAFFSGQAPQGWQAHAMALGILVLASVIGKLIGLARARQRLTAEVAAVLARV